MPEEPRYLFLDTETTGLDSATHRLFEVCCLEMKDRRLTGQQFHRYCNPEREIEVPSITGISSAFLQDKPKFSEIAEELYAFIQGAILVAHNAPFDIGFLEHEFELIGFPHRKITEYCTVIDTLPLARQRHPGQRNSLDALKKRYRIEGDRSFHGALLDAQILAEVYLALTGGQTSLLGLEPVLESAQSLESIRLDPIAPPPMTVIHANEEEQKQHEALLAALLKKSGKAKSWV